METLASAWWSLSTASLIFYYVHLSPVLQQRVSLESTDTRLNLWRTMDFYFPTGKPNFIINEIAALALGPWPCFAGLSLGFVINYRWPHGIKSRLPPPQKLDAFGSCVLFWTSLLYGCSFTISEIIMWYIWFWVTILILPFCAYVGFGGRNGSCKAAHTHMEAAMPQPSLSPNEPPLIISLQGSDLTLTVTQQDSFGISASLFGTLPWSSTNYGCPCAAKAWELSLCSRFLRG